MSLTVAYKEVNVRDGQSPNYTADSDGQSSTRYLMFNWADIAQAEYEILGFPYVTNEIIKRHLPEKDPLKPWLWAARVSDFHGLASDGTDTIDGIYLAKYKKAVLKVDYTWRPYPVLANDEIETEYDRFVEIEEHSSGDYVTPPGFRMKWVSDGKAAPVSVGKIVPYAHITFRWHQVPYDGYPKDAIDNCNGKVNKLPLGRITNPIRYFAAGTMLFLGARRIQKSSVYTDGAKTFTVEYYFRKDHNGHNTFLDFRQDPVIRGQITRDGVAQTTGSVVAGKCIYDEADLNKLFEAPR